MTGIIHEKTGNTVETIVAVNTNAADTAWRADREGYGMLTDEDVASVPDALAPGVHAVDLSADPPVIVTIDRESYEADDWAREYNGADFSDPAVLADALEDLTRALQ